MRLDKWLWAARFFKTRSLAAQAVDGGKVSHNGKRCKPASEVRINDVLVIRKAEMEWQVSVRGLSDKRGPAKTAQELYEETEQSRAMREEQGELRKLTRDPSLGLKGRPTKRERRRLADWTGK